MNQIFIDMLVLGNCDARISLMYKNAENGNDKPTARAKEVVNATTEKFLTHENRKGLFAFLFSRNLQLAIK